MQALLSVSNKENIIEFAKALHHLGYKLLSTGGTLGSLLAHSIPAIDVGSYTQSPELFDGRVKTLHPKIHGGILHQRNNPHHKEQAQSQNIEPIDIVCVNLYPFKATTEKTDDFEEIIENIDIGGPSMIRAAAKNFQDVLVITEPSDYALVIEKLQNKANTLDFRREMMIKAFEHTAQYDCFIANYMNERFHQGMGDKVFISGSKVSQTRYGENPHQKGALYEFGDFYKTSFKTLKGEGSFNNFTDMNAAIKIATSFGNSPAVCIVKHGNPCGFAIKENLQQSYQAALKCDPISAYGGVLAINGVVDKPLAEIIAQTFIEVLIAGNLTQEALQVFEGKKRMKIFSSKSDLLKFPKDNIDFKHIEGGFVYQEADFITKEEVQNAQLMSDTKATDKQYKDLEIAYKIAAMTKSNCVAYVKDATLIAIGMGMTSRVDAAKAALNKAKDLGISTQGSVLASEAFFPFRDSIDMAASAGICAIIEPGGSIRDDEVIQSANENKIALYFTGTRHFLH